MFKKNVQALTALLRSIVTGLSSLKPWKIPFRRGVWALADNPSIQDAVETGGSRVQDQPGLLRDTSTKQNFFKKKMEDGVWLNKPLILLERRKHPDIKVIHCHLLNWGD